EHGHEVVLGDSLAGANERVLGFAHDPGVGDRAALRSQGEAVLALTDRQSGDVARDDVLQQAGRVTTGDTHERELAALADGGAGAGGLELLADGCGGAHDRSVTPRAFGLPRRRRSRPRRARRSAGPRAAGARS